MLWRQGWPMESLSLQAGLPKSARSNTDLENWSTMLDGNHPKWRFLPNRCFFFNYAIITDFLKVSAAPALQQCESCSQKTPTLFRELWMCSRNSQRTTNHFMYESETNQPWLGDLIHRSRRHQAGHVDFLLEDTPEKEMQMLASSFSCHLGLVIPNQTPRSRMVSRQYCICQE